MVTQSQRCVMVAVHSNCRDLYTPICMYVYTKQSMLNMSVFLAGSGTVCFFWANTWSEALPSEAAFES